MKTALILLSIFSLTAQADNRPASEIAKVFSAFSEGRSEFYSSGSKKEFCQPFSNWDKTYCMDGYYYASHESTLSRPLAKVKESLPDYISKSAPKDTLGHQSFFRSLGLSFVQFNINPMDLSDIFTKLSESEQLFFIDGWGAGQYHKFGYLQARQSCAAAPENLRSGCYWGMGRSFLLTGIPAGSSLVFDDNFIAGYLFTRTLLSSALLDVKAVDKINVKATRAGELFKLFVAKSGELKKSLPKVNECLSEQHFSKCLRQ